MCLYDVDNSIKDKKYGYKIIKKNGKAMFLESKKLPIGKWLNEYNYRQDYYKKEKYLFLESNEFSKYSNRLAYSMGWHVFYTQREAISYNKCVLGSRAIEIVKVRIKDIVAKGHQSASRSFRTIVCKYIKIEKGNR